MKSFIVLLSCCLLPAFGAAAQGTAELHESIIVDGTYAGVTSGHYYDTIQATNGGRLDISLINSSPIQVGRFYVDEQSNVICQDWQGIGRYGDQSADGSGGSYGGRGGGENAGDLLGNPNLPDIICFRAPSGEQWRSLPQGGKSFLVRCVPSGDWLETSGGLSGGNAESTWIVADEFHLEGKITYNGKQGGNVETENPCSGFYIGGGGGGGGAGGGILILARTLYIGPNAEITANGAGGGLGARSMRELTGEEVYASFGEDGFPGAGGRIKIFYEQGTIEPGAVIVALPGLPNDREPFAEDGTVWIQQVPSIDQIPPPADLDCNGVVDSNDLFLLMQQWYQGVTPTPTVTPSPTYTPTPTPSPTPTRGGFLPAPENVRVEGEEVPGEDDEFYETATISWDSIPNFEVIDSSNFYRLDFGYGQEWYEPATFREVSESTSIVVNIDDSDLDPDSVELDGLTFFIAGVEVTEDGGHFVGEESPWHWFRLVPHPTPSPTPTNGTYVPSPSNVRIYGDEVPGEQDEFYETVTISWDPIPNFEVVDSSNYYMLDFGYGKEWSGPATVRRATDSTSIVVNIDDSDLDQSLVEIAGLVFQVMGVVVIEDGGRFVGGRSTPRWFRLLPRPMPTPTATPHPTPSPTP